MKRIMMLAVAVSVLAMYSWANKVDQKFYEKASKIVWAMELPQFDSKAQVPDSLYANESAVIIACYRSVDVKRVEHSNISKYTTTLNAYTNAIDCKKVMRVMVKLKDAAAVEKFSEFDIDAKDKESIDSYNIMHTNSAFGARVYKADGQVNDVDCSEVFTVTEGKKDKAMKHKIAIPGLEPGDVLEYFYYDEIWLDELDLDPIQFPFFRDYPTINYTIRCSIDPQLTVEYRSYNGAPLLFGSVEKDGTRILQVETSNLPKNDKGKWQSFAIFENKSNSLIDAVGNIVVARNWIINNKSYITNTWKDFISTNSLSYDCLSYFSELFGFSKSALSAFDVSLIGTDRVLSVIDLLT